MWAERDECRVGIPYLPRLFLDVHIYYLLQVYYISYYSAKVKNNEKL